MYVAPPANFLLSHAIFHESETRDSEDSQRRRHRLISTQRRLFPSREFLSFPRLLLIVSLPHTKSRRILRSFNGAQASELTRYPGSTMNTYNRFAQPLYPISRRSSPPPPPLIDRSSRMRSKMALSTVMRRLRRVLKTSFSRCVVRFPLLSRNETSPSTKRRPRRR